MFQNHWNLQHNKPELSIFISLYEIIRQNLAKMLDRSGQICLFTGKYDKSLEYIAQNKHNFMQIWVLTSLKCYAIWGNVGQSGLRWSKMVANYMYISNYNNQ